MTVYAVYCQYYQETEIEKVFFTKKRAKEYADEKNKAHQTTCGWTVWSLDVED